jgi:glycine/D-amino acid oxidase-like deaminating enzyme
VLRDPDHVGAVYALDECVLDTPSLLAALAQQQAGCIRAGMAKVTDRGDHVALDVAGRHITAARLVSTAGAGNEALLPQLGLAPQMAQRRPLHMLLVENPPAPLWAHCFDTSDKPRVTITTHRRGDGMLVWYVGGLIAENGVAQSEAELIATGRQEFATLLPKLDLSRSRFAGFRIDRAEGATEDGRKPDGPVLQRKGNILLAWPTKLALAPRLADLVLADLPPPSGNSPPDWSGWPAPAIAAAPWETVSWK